MRSADPYLYFPGNTREAFDFYKSVFGGDFVDVLTYGDMGGNEMGVTEAELGLIAHIALPLGDSLLMGTDETGSAAKRMTTGTNFYITLEADTEDEADRVYNGLTAGGKATLPLEETPWAKKYGMCTDRYGVQWMVMYSVQP